MASVDDLLLRSIPELRELFLERSRSVPKGLLEALEVDTRAGAQQLARRIRERYRSNRVQKVNAFTPCYVSRLTSGHRVSRSSPASMKQEWLRSRAR